MSRPRPFQSSTRDTLRVNKRLSKRHFAAAPTTSTRTPSTMPVRWAELRRWWRRTGRTCTAEEGNSSFDQRHKVSGTYLYELPFGKDKRWVTTGAGSHILEGFSVSGSFTFATGTPLTPSYQAAACRRGMRHSWLAATRSCAGVSVTAGAGSLKEWFNPAAFTRLAANSGYPALSSATLRATRLPGRERSRTICRSRRPCSWATRAAWRSAPRPTMSSTLCSTAGVDTNVASPSFGQVTSAGCHAGVSIYGEVQVLASSGSVSMRLTRSRSTAVG